MMNSPTPVDAAHIVTVQSGFDDGTSSLPNALQNWDVIVSRLSGKIPAIFLDYDGTLAPIVKDPSEARITKQMEEGLKNLSRSHRVAIVTGRPQRKIKNFMDMSSFYYASNHGLDMYAPNHRQIDTVGAERIKHLKEALQSLNETLGHISGIRIEDNDLSVSVHYRGVELEHRATIKQVVENVVATAKNMLKKTDGKLVFEVMPNVEWNKGFAVKKLLNLIYSDDADVVPFYIGDDKTDEDAFAVIADTGIGILVSEEYRPTRATFIVSSPDEVLQVMNLLCDIPGPSILALP